MKCSYARQQIFAERDGALGEPQRAALAEHVAGCPDCRRVRDDLTVTIETWRQEFRQARVPSADLEWQKLRREIRGAPAHRRHSMTTWIAVPTAAAAAVAIGLYVAPHERPHAAANSAAQTVAVNNPPATAATPAATSTVVYVDDKSGWTFVWEPTANGQQI